MSGMEMRNPFARRGEFIGWTWGLMFLHVATWILVRMTGGRAIELLAWTPGSVAAGRWWTPFTYQFLSGSGLRLAFVLLSLFYLGLALEHEWGTFTYVVFYLFGVFGAFGAAALVGFPLAGSVFLGVSYLITFAILWPDTPFLVFFVVPVKVKYLAMLAAGTVILGAIQEGPLYGAIYAVGMSAGALFYFVVLRPRRPVIRQAVAAVKEAGRISSEDRLEVSNRAFFRRASELRPPGGIAEPDGGAALDRLREQLRAQVHPDVAICKPVDYKGDMDGICIRCEGFAECTLRWLKGEPKEIVPPRQ